MELHKDSPIVHNLFCKRDLLLRGDDAHERIRTILVICGGAMRGAYGAGAMLALLRLGFADCFDVVIGISTGAAIAGYFLAGVAQGLLGTSIYYEECLDGFIDFTRWPIADVDYIERIMHSGRKKLDVDAILKHRSRFFVGATDWEDGMGRFLDVKCAEPGPLAAIKASLAVTELYRRPVIVNGRRFTDGSIAMPFPAEKILREFGATDMLVIANCPQSEANRPSSLTRKAMMHVAMLGLSPKLRMRAAEKRDSWLSNLTYLRNEDNGANVGIFWGPSSIGRLTLDPNLLRAAVEEGARNILFAFGQPNFPLNLL